MDIKVTVTEREGVDVATLHGRLDTANRPHFEKLLEKVSEGERHLILNLGGVDYISSDGCRYLVALAKKKKANEMELYLANLDDEVKDVITMTGLHQVLNIYDTNEKALDKALGRA